MGTIALPDSPARVQLRVPGSTSNLGPGQDTIGLALQLYNEFLFERTDGESEVIVEGEGADLLNQGESRTYQALKHASAVLGVPAPTVRITQRNAVPLARGLGGSGTATLAGVVAGFLLAGREPVHSAVLDMAYGIEGHPDNVTPGLVGGLTISLTLDEQVKYLKLTLPADLTTVVLIPDRGLDTGLSRDILPRQFSRDDAIFNIRGTAMTIGALASGNLEHLALGMRDRLHQPYRATLLPGMMEMIQTALDAGSPGAALNGAGSGIFAFAYAHNARTIGAAMEAEAARHGMQAYSLYLPIDNDGIQITCLE